MSGPFIRLPRWPEFTRLVFMDISDSFRYARLGAGGPSVLRMGLSASYWPGRQTVYHALDQGLSVFFAYGFDRQMIRVLREAMATDRERVQLVTGAYNLIWTHQNIRRTLERRLRQFHTDRIDHFLFLGVMKPEQLPERVVDELHALRAEGKVGRIGMSCHDRAFAGRLAREGIFDCFMIRYNAAHRGAETDVFPHLDAHDPALISYTATRWTALLRRPKGQPSGERIPSAEDCYRFVLSNPHVDVVLTAPSNLDQFKQNLKALEAGPLSPDDLTFMTAFGDRVHDQKKYFMGGK